jgi:hypothetical protein
MTRKSVRGVRSKLGYFSPARSAASKDGFRSAEPIISRDTFEMMGYRFADNPSYVLLTTT